MIPSLEELLGNLGAAEDADIVKFVEQVEAHPTWFIWSLNQRVAYQRLKPHAQRIAFLTSESAPKYRDSLSNVAGIKVFGNANGHYVAVDLLAYERAQTAKILERSPETEKLLLEEFAQGTIKLLGFFDPDSVKDNDAVFVWLLGASPAQRAAVSELKALGLDVAPTVSSPRVVLVSKAGLSGSGLAAYVMQNAAGYAEGTLPRYRLLLPDKAGVEQQLIQLKDSLKGGTIDLAWKSQAAPETYSSPASHNERWMNEIHLRQAWVTVGEVLGRNWYKKVEQDRPGIAILDTAVDFDHPALLDTWWGSSDETDPGAEAISDQLRTNLHGTACAGLVAGYEERDGKEFFRGVAAGCRLGSIRVRAASSSDNYGYPAKKLPFQDSEMTLGEQAARAIRNAFEKGKAKVINLSWQYNGVKRPSDETAEHRAIRAAIEAAVENGCVVVAAAGNVSSDMARQLMFPAYMEEVIAVAGAVRADTLLTFRACLDLNPTAQDYPKGCHRYGCGRPRCDFPVASRHDARITVAAPAVDLATTDVHDFAGIALGAGGGDYTDFYATSAAAPIVSGVVALMLAVNQDLTPLAIKDILRRTATKGLRDCNPGFPQPRPLPFGFLNCQEAMIEAINWKPQKGAA